MGLSSFDYTHTQWLVAVSYQHEYMPADPC